MDKYALVLILVLIGVLTASIGFAAAPGSTLIFQPESGFDMSFPLIDFLPVNKPYTFLFHVINASNGVPILNATTQCLFHLFNNSGEHQYQKDNIKAMEGPYTWAVKVNKENFSSLGHYSFIFQCNSTQQNRGGLVLENFEVIKNTKLISNKDTTSGISITLFVLLVTSIFFVIPFVIPRLKENDVMALILRRCSFLVGIFLMMFNAAILSSIVEASLLGLEDEMFRYMWLFGRAGWIFMMFLFFKTILDVMKLWKIQKKEKRMGDD